MKISQTNTDASAGGVATMCVVAGSSVVLAKRVAGFVERGPSAKSTRAELLGE